MGNNDLFIIAEIGINHSGSLSDAKKLIDMAKDCGADAVKFQKRTVSKVYTPTFLAEKRESPFGITQKDQKEGLELKEQDYDEIDKYCHEKKIYWFASAWDEDSQIFLREYNCLFNKIASAMITKLDFVRLVAKENKQTFISTGGSPLSEIKKAVEIFKEEKTSYTLMHCVSIYPCDDKYCNINMIGGLKNAFHCDVGYSGHELGITPSLLAVAMGASAIERHITLNRAAYGSDQSASLEKRGLEILVRESRLVHEMMGSGKKDILEKEKQVMKKLRYWDERE